MPSSASFLGVPLSLVSLVTLTVQNSALTIVLHYSRISVPKDKSYSAASAVLLNELLKGAISLSIAFRNAVAGTANAAGRSYAKLEGGEDDHYRKGVASGSAWDMERVQAGGRKLLSEVFSRDCWKLSIPACLYVIQNNLQFVAASNLDVPTFQVTYNLKILTTALFSVILLRRRLSPKKWFALLFLAAGVGVVQLQSSAAAGSSSNHGGHEMNQAKGLLAVMCACMTSGLAGVYFEMVLKGSKADLWIRNVQLSFFSLLPAVMAVFAPEVTLFGGAAKPPAPIQSQPIFANFGWWAWAVVSIQVIGGLVTALVIRYSDNIMKGFATSLAIVLSFCAGIILFDFQVTLSFLVGTAMVVTSTYLYNQPDGKYRVLPQ
ncbi:nucleotide-sugar transporter [Rhodotorula sp. JG-1b]|nr:nucleotide-sugar transporter [Rhodotorula sp. JG-1b]